ncbi:hypothetical protein [Phytohabitans rumicis]|uniref:PRC-barrel domain-containing protein n=1 Tax=Phytohabitans rumicis TaxID=1076125 RepID=A0A6V8LGI7_9ACTN|nr:hypothetical protein [Phytohabitans rumicis]GFJ93226.1 hypothetical protein Prum_068680 [Phytohabitans rumicis]
MSTPTHELVGRALCDSDGRSVGTITAIYQYPDELRAPWGAAAVTHGVLRRSTHLVDLENADLDADPVRVPHTRRTITTAPNYPALIGDTLADHHAADVRAHYWGAAQPA